MMEGAALDFKAQVMEKIPVLMLGAAKDLLQDSSNASITFKSLK